MKSFFLSILLGMIFLSCGFHAWALEDPKTVVETKRIGFVTELGRHVDPTLTFRDIHSKEVSLGSLFKAGIPTILVPMYYTCPRLCGFLLNGLKDLIRDLPLTMGTDYQVISVSFNPAETSEVALEKAQSVFSELKMPNVNESSWHFLVGEEKNVSALMEQIGFRYEKDGDEYAHSSGIIILTPEGEISQYFTGIEFPKWDIKLSLVESSKGTIG